MNFEEFDLASNGKDVLAFSEKSIYSSNKEPTVITPLGKKELSLSGDTAFFEFISDGSINAKGFLARYQTDQSAQGRVG